MAIFPCGSAIQPAVSGFYEHPIEQSLRFNSADNAYLNWTPASAGNRKTWTWSGWVKRGNLGSYQVLFGAGSSTSNRLCIRLDVDKLYVFEVAGGSTVDNVGTNAVFRDPSSWYHVTVTYNSTESTSTDRIKIYVNGELQTSLASTDYPSLDYNGYVNLNASHFIGMSAGSTQYIDAYLAEVHFIDGQALDASYFGETVSGVWIPKAYNGSHGTNGFYLDFGNSGSIGADVSGNGNNFTANNLAATDVVLDSPTNNFATGNPLYKRSYTSFSEGNLKVTPTAASWGHAPASFGLPSSGKWYWEVLAHNNHIGPALSSPTVANTDANAFLGYDSPCQDAWAYESNGRINNNGTQYTGYATFTAGDVMGMAVDVDAGTLKFYKNNTLQYTTPSGLDFAGWVPDLATIQTSASGGYNFGQDSSFWGNKTAQGNTDDNGYGDFYYAPPTGYLALCTANLTVPDAMNPALGNSPQDYFGTLLWSGNDTYPRNIATGETGVTGDINFTPDLVWTKTRNYAYDHIVYDSVRGTGTSKSLVTNGTSAEGTNAAYANLSNFITNGFEADTTSGTNVLNVSGRNFVAWNWKANGSGISNTDGSITSTVSANTDAGFSIVSYSGNSTAGATVGHGLTSTPELIIVKKRNGADPWQTYSATLGGTKRLELNSTSAAITSTASWNDTDPTSTVFTLGSGGYGNASGYNYIAYCFHSVEGFSKMGSYTGNGSTDGPFVYTGFRPAFLMVKRTDAATTGWSMQDSVRSNDNPANEWLIADTSDVESSGADYYDLLSNGFKSRYTGAFNASGGTYIYMAFSSNPFKYSTAV